jgi:hypothetical protein
MRFITNFFIKITFWVTAIIIVFLICIDFHLTDSQGFMSGVRNRNIFLNRVFQQFWYSNALKNVFIIVQRSDSLFMSLKTRKLGTFMMLLFL